MLVICSSTIDSSYFTNFLLFLLYINDLPNILKSKSIPILFADDTSIIVKNPNRIEYENELTLLLKTINEWFKANLLILNLDKTCFVQFSTKNSNIMNKPFSCSNNHITSFLILNFLGWLLMASYHEKDMWEPPTVNLALANHSLETISC
jgi:hypothetical protein